VIELPGQLAPDRALRLGICLPSQVVDSPTRPELSAGLESEAAMREAIDGSRFGVELMNPIDHYRMAERSVKYAGLFIVLTFAAVWLIEVLARVRVHPIQYLMIGGALCLFYLLELSLSSTSASRSHMPSQASRSSQWSPRTPW